MASQRALAADFGECGRERLPELDVRVLFRSLGWAQCSGCIAVSCTRMWSTRAAMGRGKGEVDTESALLCLGCLWRFVVV